MLDKDKMDEYKIKLNSGLEKIADYIKESYNGKILFNKQITSNINLDEEFKLKLFINIPLNIYFGVHYGFDYSDGYYEINLKFDNKITSSQKFNLDYTLINENLSIDNLINSVMIHIRTYLDDILH